MAGEKIAASSGCADGVFDRAKLILRTQFLSWLLEIPMVVQLKSSALNKNNGFSLTDR
jgi:hypothetical protein